MEKLYRSTLTCLLAAVLALASSCDNDYGSLKSIQDEIAQEGTDTFKKTTVTRALRLSNAYYVSTGAKIYTRDATNDDAAWSVLPVDGSVAYNIMSMTSGGTDLYVAIQDSSGANKVYRWENSTTWSAVSTATVPSTSLVDKLVYAGTTLFAEVHNDYANAEDVVDDTYSLYYLSGTDLVAATTLQSMSVPLVDVAWDSSNYWFATTATLYRGDSAATAADVTLSSFGNLAYGTITSLHYSATDAVVYAGTYEGHVINCTAAAGTDSVAGTNNDLGDFPIGAIEDLGANSPYLIIGLATTTDDSTGGYYEGAFGSFVSGDEKTFGQYSTTLYSKAVLDLFWDATGQRLFACVAPGTSTACYGLYSTTLSDTDWTAE